MENMEVDYPAVERRKKNVLTDIIEMFTGRQSRKVAFGIWGFIACNGFLAAGKITPDIWWKCFLTCALLIGFGTILDSVIGKVGTQLASKIADKIKAEGSGADPASS